MKIALCSGQTKNMCVMGYMLLNIRVGRWEYSFFFHCEITLFSLSTFFIKTELAYLHFSACHVMSWLVVPSFLIAANSLISAADVLFVARERYTNTFSKVSFDISCNKNILETENIFLREESITKSQK